MKIPESIFWLFAAFFVIATGTEIIPRFVGEYSPIFVFTYSLSIALTGILFAWKGIEKVMEGDKKQ